MGGEGGRGERKRWRRLKGTKETGAVEGGGVIVFGAGGTGGHVFPALALAQHIRKRGKDNGSGGDGVNCYFLGTSQRLESRVVPSAGFPFFSLRGAEELSLRRPLFFPPSHFLHNALLVPLRLLLVLRHALLLLWQLKPHVVVTTGGAISFPTALAALLLNVPLIVQEQNASPGVANVILGFFARKVILGFAEASSSFPPHPRTLVLGNPLREGMRRRRGSESSSAARRAWFGGGEEEKEEEYWSEGKVVVVVGGSLGAVAINRAVEECVEELVREGWKVIWQTGSRYYDQIAARMTLRRGYRGVVENPSGLEGDGKQKEKRPQRERGGPDSQCVVRVVPFLEDMEEVYALADLAVCRAGALTCSELLATCTPSILIPSPNVTGNHQEINADALSKLGVAYKLSEEEMCGDSDDIGEEGGGGVLMRTIQLVGTKEGLREMSDAAATANEGKEPAASSIAAAIEEIMNTKRRTQNVLWQVEQQ